MKNTVDTIAFFVFVVICSVTLLSAHPTVAERLEQTVVCISTTPGGEEIQGSGFIVSADGLVVTADHC